MQKRERAIMDDGDHSRMPAVNGRVEDSGPDPGKIVLAVNSVIAAVGDTLASTHSIVATLVAGCAGVVCAVVIAWKR
jgi:L-serine deaminase